MAQAHQIAIAEAMMRADFYSHPAPTIHRRETHISTVFLTGSFVDKMKKAVEMGFLDFSTLTKRRHYCQQEVALNRRLSYGIYLAVVPITWHRGRYWLQGPGPTVEFAVRMRQLRESDAMYRCLQRAALTEAQLDTLVRLRVDFYARAATIREADAEVAPAWEDNLQQVGTCAGVYVDHDTWEAVATATKTFARLHQILFQRRFENQKIKEGHGDLRSDHIYFTETGIHIIDCIEFSEQLRCLDIISDLAFLAMDLEYRGFVETAHTIIQRYVHYSHDIGALPLLDFYRCYRAMVCCKTHCCRLREGRLAGTDLDACRASVHRYLRWAYDYAMAFSQPRLWVVYGLPASGKSTIAAALADVIAVPVFVACQAAEQRLVARLKQRELDPPLSDARLGHLAAFKQCFDPITDMDQALHIRLDTGLRPSVCLRQLLLAEVFSAGVNRRIGRGPPAATTAAQEAS
jgi:aminoglycoside phosphotransferase family enzyme